MKIKENKNKKIKFPMFLNILLVIFSMYLSLKMSINITKKIQLSCFKTWNHPQHFFFNIFMSVAAVYSYSQP